MIFWGAKFFEVSSSPTDLPTVWGGRLRKRSCNMFSGSSPCLPGQHGSCSSAQLPVELSENMLQNLLLNQPQTVVSMDGNLTLVKFNSSWLKKLSH